MEVSEADSKARELSIMTQRWEETTSLFVPTSRAGWKGGGW
jgi:hypothetical protein